MFAKINPSPWRKGWQEFKQRNPSFEKSKGYKASLGPALDQTTTIALQIAKAETDLIALRSKLLSLATSYESACKLADGAIKEYEKIVHNAKNEKMLTDWNVFQKHTHDELQRGMALRKMMEDELRF